MGITIYHNPDCGTSRNALAPTRNSDAKPIIICCLEMPPSRDELCQLIAAIVIPVRALLRKDVGLYDALGLAEGRFTDDQLVGSMLQHPILISRPIVTIS